MPYGNSGPAREVWSIGDRVIYIGNGTEHGITGIVATPRRDPMASEQEWIWVNWEDGERGYIDPGMLDVFRK